MNAIADLQPSATLVEVPSNPVPQGAVAGIFETPDSVKLRYATFPKGGGAAKGTICLVQGRTEFIEKYFETIADLQSRGFAVATFDWRGQGGSQRLIGNARLGYVDTFDDYWTDLKAFHCTILLPDCPPPYYLVGHSMGGLVSLMAAARDRMMFERVFLSAPMLALDQLPLSTGGMATLTEVLSFAGLGQMPAGRRADRSASEMSFAGNPVTSDPVRFMRSVDVLKARPELEVGPPTVRWLAAAFRAMAMAGADAFPGTIKIPVLMLAAARDRVVSTPAIEHLGLRLRTGRHAVIATARHELFMENDDIRGQVFAAFDAFITEQSA
jgi:lysophospholipase